MGRAKSPQVVAGAPGPTSGRELTSDSQQATVFAAVFLGAIAAFRQVVAPVERPYDLNALFRFHLRHGARGRDCLLCERERDRQWARRRLGRLKRLAVA